MVAEVSREIALRWMPLDLTDDKSTLVQVMAWCPQAHGGRDKMTTILQTTFSNAFSWQKMFEFRLKFHWTLFLRVQLTIFQHWFRWWLGAVQATSHYLNQWWFVYWRIYASLGLNELNIIFQYFYIDVCRMSITYLTCSLPSSVLQETLATTFHLSYISVLFSQRYNLQIEYCSLPANNNM